MGSGQLAKLVNNLVFTALVSVGLETFAFGDALGMDRAALAPTRQVQRRQSGRSDPRRIGLRKLGDAPHGQEPQKRRSDHA